MHLFAQSKSFRFPFQHIRINGGIIIDPQLLPCPLLPLLFVTDQRQVFCHNDVRPFPCDGLEIDRGKAVKRHIGDIHQKLVRKLCRELADFKDTHKLLPKPEVVSFDLHRGRRQKVVDTKSHSPHMRKIKRFYLHDLTGLV